MPNPSLFRRALAVLVGLFATWQLVFIPAANLIVFVPRRASAPLEPASHEYQVRGTFTSFEPLQRTVDRAGDAVEFWAEASGQVQGWSLFAPGPPPYSVIPAAEFQFADGTSDTALSPFEPADKLNPPLRAPLFDNRAFNTEASLTYNVTFAPPELVGRAPEHFRHLPETALAARGPVRAWLALRLKEYRAAHPERPAPVAVVLKHRYIPTPPPGAPRGWTLPVAERPYARWFPATDAYEGYDAVEKKWVKP
jgi:hypothetical protein